MMPWVPSVGLPTEGLKLRVQEALGPWTTVSVPPYLMPLLARAAVGPIMAAMSMTTEMTLTNTRRVAGDRISLPSSDGHGGMSEFRVTTARTVAGYTRCPLLLRSYPPTLSTLH